MPVSWAEIVRLVHVVGAMLWFGGMAFGILVLGPTVRAAGDAGKAFMGAAMKRGGFARYMGPLGIVTLASGLLLYWLRDYFEGPFANGPASSITVGAIIALVVVGVGYAVSLPAQRRMKEIGASIGPGGPTAEQGAEMATLGARQAKMGNAMLAFIGTTVLLMVGRNLFA